MDTDMDTDMDTYMDTMDTDIDMAMNKVGCPAWTWDI
jgi:hypothetical protein